MAKASGMKGKAIGGSSVGKVKFGTTVSLGQGFAPANMKTVCGSQKSHLQCAPKHASPATGAPKQVPATTNRGTIKGIQKSVKKASI